MDVVWLKKDVRLHDHAPLSSLAADRCNNRPCIILYLYEPDQLSEGTVHGSHVAFVNEGLVDLDLTLTFSSSSGRNGGSSIATATATTTEDVMLLNDTSRHKFQCITVCHAGAVFTFQTLHRQRPIHQILCHMETSHLKSFARDKAVRRWCRINSVPIREFNQTGVTRGSLANRDDFTKKFNLFLDEHMPKTPSSAQLAEMRQRLVDVEAEGIVLHGMCRSPLNARDMQEILPVEERNDRANRQRGGETVALDMLRSFLSRRGANYSSGISSPNTSWTTGSRLSPYLTWGHISLRFVIVSTKRRQEELRAAKEATRPPPPSPWLRSLASFQSRMHWRSHFMQKLESEPSIEEQDQCLAFSHLRRQPNDFRQEHYDAWCEGRTGYPFVDACMRCLLESGWLNFRMRAMLVSFATYNLWLDWRRISHHLARVFLDYEPGIHYPQLQMQAGTTGINAMRVYNVTKQGKDQDPKGVFIRKYVAELRRVPDDYIHEPWKMSASMQKKYVTIGGSNGAKMDRLGFPIVTQASTNSLDNPEDDIVSYYPSPIVDEKESAKRAKDKLSAVRKQESTKVEAQQVFLKHGSRRSRGEDRDGGKPKALSSAVKRVKICDKGQMSLLSSLVPSSKLLQNNNIAGPQHESIGEQNHSTDSVEDSAQKATSIQPLSSETKLPHSMVVPNSGEWSCTMCTYVNDKPIALVCSMCGSVRR